MTSPAWTPAFAAGLSPRMLSIIAPVRGAPSSAVTSRMVTPISGPWLKNEPVNSSNRSRPDDLLARDDGRRANQQPEHARNGEGAAGLIQSCGCA